jgi:hypothetical protein
MGAEGPPAREMMRFQMVSLCRLPPTMTRLPFWGPTEGEVVLGDMGVARAVVAEKKSWESFMLEVLGYMWARVSSDV